MEIEKVDIYDLKPADYNPRILKDRAYVQIKKSLEEFGFVEPIVVNKNKDRKNIIVGGHQRVFVAKELGIAKIPVVYVDLVEERERELNIRLNKNTGAFDFDVLANNFDVDDLLDLDIEEMEIK